MGNRQTARLGVAWTLIAGVPLACGPEETAQLREQPRAPAAEEKVTEGGEDGMPPLELVSIRAADYRPGPGAGDRPVDGTVRLLAPRSGEFEGFHMYTRVEGLRPGEHAWHIHAGPCGTDAAVVVAFTATKAQQGIDQPLVAGSDGKAMETAFLPGEALSRQQLERGAYSVRIHERGGTDHGAVVACAEI